MIVPSRVYSQTIQWFQCINKNLRCNGTTIAPLNQGGDIFTSEVIDWSFREIFDRPGILQEETCITWIAIMLDKHINANFNCSILFHTLNNHNTHYGLAIKRGQPNQGESSACLASFPGCILLSGKASLHCGHLPSLRCFHLPHHPQGIK